MEFKPLEIVAIVFALALPVAAFGLLFIPGGFDAVVNFVLNSETRPLIFYGAAGVVVLVLGYRLYRRIRPRPCKPD